MCFSTPEMPQAAAMPEPTGQSQRRKKANKAKDVQGMKAQTNQGRSNTVLTGPMGDTDTANIGQQTLLGS